MTTTPQKGKNGNCNLSTIKEGGAPKRQSVSTLRRILVDRNESTAGTKRDLLRRVQLGEMTEDTEQDEKDESILVETLQEWTGIQMKDYLRTND